MCFVFTTIVLAALLLWESVLEYFVDVCCKAVDVLFVEEISKVQSKNLAKEIIIECHSYVVVAWTRHYYVLLVF